MHVLGNVSSERLYCSFELDGIIVFMMARKQISCHLLSVPNKHFLCAWFIFFGRMSGMGSASPAALVPISASFLTLSPSGACATTAWGGRDYSNHFCGSPFFTLIVTCHFLLQSMRSLVG